MTGDVEVDDGDEARWAQAESILAGTPSPEAQRRLRRRRNLLIILIVGVPVLGATAGLLVGFLARGQHHPTHQPTGSSATIGLIVSGLGLVIEAVALVLIVRRVGWGQAWRSPLVVLSRRQRRSLLQQIRGRRPVDPARLPLARYVADRLSVQVRLTLPIFVGLTLITAGNLLTRRSVFTYALGGYWVVLLALALVFGGRQTQQARRFLEDHPAPED